MSDDINLPVTEAPQPLVQYGELAPRIGAVIVDGLVLSPLTIIMLLNSYMWKSAALIIIGSLLGMAYKPYMEYRYGATVGKRMIGLKVVNLLYHKISVKEAVLRSIFTLGYGIAALLMSVMVAYTPGYEDVHNMDTYNKFLMEHTYNLVISLVMGVLFIADALVMVADYRRRALHDKIAKTYVISV